MVDFCFKKNHQTFIQSNYIILIKKVAKYGRKEQRLPETCLQTGMEYRETFSQQYGFHQLKTETEMIVMEYWKGWKEGEGAASGASFRGF